ncbi:MAG: cytochrome c family protein [Desulfobulbaceae bacterium]|nr:cytochrome c family protein [Desulfobulbaceae bacterium]
MKKLITGLVMAMGLSVTVGMVPAMAAPQGVKAPAQELTIDGKKPARFNHATHLKLGVSCGQCHHDAKHQPLTEAAISGLPAGEKLRCATCHNEGFANAKLRKPMAVFHARCQECHKQGVANKKGPTSCKDCHIAGKPKKAIEGC